MFKNMERMKDMVGHSPDGKKVLAHYDFQYLGPRIHIQLETMLKRKMEVTLLRWVRNQQSLSSEPGWTTIDISIPGATGQVSILSALPELYRAMNRQAANLDFDLIQVSSLTLLPLALYLSRKSRVPVVYDAYEFYAFNYARHFGFLSKYMQKILELLENKMVSHVDGVFCIDSNKNSLVERYERSNKNTVSLYNVPSINDIDICNKENKFALLDQDISYIAFTGAFHEVAGSAQILKAIELVRKTHIQARLLRIGYSFFQDASLISKEEIQQKDYCTCLPFMPYADMLQYLQQAKMGLVLYQKHPKFEPLGSGTSRKLFTYMAAGLPVVGSQIAAITKVIEETGCGLLVDESSPAAIAEAVGFLLDHPQEAEKMGARGRQAILEKYNWEREEPKFWQVYEQAMNSH